MRSLDRVWDPAKRAQNLIISGIAITTIALIDWLTKPYVSLGFLYLFPIMLAAGFLPRWLVVLLGAGCAVLSDAFSSLERSFVRLGFETLALAGCGLFVAELLRNRRLTLEAQERLRTLVETSPAAIVTIDERGFIELANRAAVDLLSPGDGQLVGSPVAAFVPELHHALRREEGPQFRASMQCRAHKGDGQSFMADVWFSTYKEGATPKLAAIVADITEEAPADLNLRSQAERVALSDRETEVLRLLVQGLTNKEIAATIEISESAVKNALHQLFSKANVRTRSQLVRVALEQYRDIL